MKGWIRLGVATAVLVAVGASAWLFGPPLYTVEPIYTDHLKHEYDSWAFLQVGFDIFSEPVIDWNIHARHPHLLWEFWPHSYPIGAVLMFLPFGVASNLGWLPDLAVHWLMITLLGAAAVWAVVKFARLRVGTAIVVFVAVSFIHWGFNGFYDPMVAGLAVVGVERFRKSDWGGAVVWLAVALSLHYRLWYLVPLALVAAWKWYQQKGFDWRLGVAATAGGISLITFALTRSAYLTLSGGAGVSLAERLGDWLSYAVVGFVVVVVAIAWLERSLVSVAAVILAGVVVFAASQFHDWYIVLLAPLFVVVSDVRSRGLLLVAWLHLGFPNVLYVVDLIVGGLQ